MLRRLLVIAALLLPASVSASPVMSAPSAVDAVRVPRLSPAYTVGELDTPELQVEAARTTPRWLSGTTTALRVPRFELPSTLSHHRKLPGRRIGLGLEATAFSPGDQLVSARVEMALCMNLLGIDVEAHVGGRSQLRAGSTAEGEHVWLPKTTAQARLRAKLPGTDLDPRVVIETPFDPVDPAGQGAGATRFLAVVDALRF